MDLKYIKMKTLVKILPILVLLVACGSGNDQISNEIVRKKQQISKLEQEVAVLEKKLDPNDSVAKESGFPVAVKQVVEAPFSHFVEVQGKLDGDQNVNVYVKGMGGVVQSVLMHIGEPVKQGQVIATLDNTTLKKTYDQTKAQYDMAKDLYDRQKTLWDQKIGSEIQFLQAKTQKEALESGLAALEEQIENMKIKSPIDGTIEDLPLKVGQAVSAQFPVAIVINFSSVKVVAEVAEAYSDRVSTGDSVSLYFPDLDKEYKTIITSASRYISPVNRSFKVEAKLNPKSNEFKANMVVVLKINDYKVKDAIAVPVNLVQTDAKGNYVYLAVNQENEKLAKKAYITTGQSYNGTVEVLSGLTPGENVIVSGHLSISENSSIKF